MKKVSSFISIFGLAICIGINFSCVGQQVEQIEGLQEAMLLYQQEKFGESAEAFCEALELVEKEKVETTHFYNWACSQAMAGMQDGAFANLNYIAFERNYSNFNHMKIDPDLESLHTDNRWNELIKKVRENKESNVGGSNKDLISFLDQIYQDDQYYRSRIDRLQKKFGWQSEEMNEHLRAMEEADSLNLIKLKLILNQYGWPSKEEIGKDGSRTLFLVIQHADVKTQEKYLPLMEEAVERGDLHAANLAMLLDRMAISKGKPQLYGTQLEGNPSSGKIKVSPITDPNNVDKRRAEIGLPPMKDYLIQFGLEWDLEEYKKTQKTNSSEKIKNK